MNKKFLSAILFGALMVTSTGTFVSCKDYDDEIDEINGKIDKIETTLADLKSQIGDKGVSSVTFDEKTGVLTVVDGTGTKTYEIKTPATDVEKTVVTVDEDKNLKVDDKVIGKLGDTVEVKDNELYVNGKATGIKVGKYAILENDADGMYTITLPNAKGELQTIKLPKTAGSGIIVTLGNATGATLFTEVGQTAEASHGINWNEASKDIDWAGAKGKITKGQLLVGQITTPKITVVPADYNLAAQTLKLVASDGSVAPVVVTATAITKENPDNTGSRTASAPENWALAIQMDKAMTKDKIATAFTTKVNNANKNLKYALSVNGALVSGYAFVIDTKETAETGDVAYASTKFKHGSVAANNGDILSGSTATANTFLIPLGKTTLTYEDAAVYDSYLSFEGAVAKQADELGIITDGMTINVPEAAAGKSLKVTLNIIGVNGNTVTNNSVTLHFGKKSVEEGTELEAVSYKATPKNGYFVVNMGSTFANIGTTKTVTATWSVGSTYLNANPTVTYYSDEACENAIKINTGDTRKIKYAKVAVDATNYQAGATAGKHTLTMVVSNSTGELKKVTVPVTVTLPEFEDLISYYGGDAWNEDHTACTLRMGYSTSAATLDMTKVFTPKDGSGVTDLTNATFAFNGELAAPSATSTTINLVTAKFKNDNKTLKVSELPFTVSYKIGGKEGLKVTSSEYTVKLKTIFEGAELKFYTAGKPGNVAKYTNTGTNTYLIATGSQLTDASKAAGLALEFGGAKQGVNSTIITKTKYSTTAGNALNGIFLSEKKGTPDEATKVQVAKAVNVKATPTIEPTGIKLADMEDTNNGKLTLTFTDANGFVTTASIDFELQK